MEFWWFPAHFGRTSPLGFYMFTCSAISDGQQAFTKHRPVITKSESFRQLQYPLPSASDQYPGNLKATAANGLGSRSRIGLPKHALGIANYKVMGNELDLQIGGIGEEMLRAEAVDT